MSSRIGYRAALATAFVFAFLSTRHAFAQFPGDIPENVRFKLGGVFASLDTKATLSSPELPGNSVDFSDLGITPDHKNTFQGTGYWNFLGRSYLDFGYVNFDVSGSNTITRDIHFGGVTYTAGAEVSGETRSRFIYAAYRYGIFRNPTFHFGLSLGVSYYTAQASLSATAGVVGPNGEVIAGGATRERELNVPVPLLGAEMELRILPTLTIGGSFRGVKLNVSPYSGTWVEGVGELNWYFARNFGLGAAYDYHHIRIEKTNATSFVRFDQLYNGPRGYLIISF
jgi:hypothetical protein